MNMRPASEIDEGKLLMLSDSPSVVYQRISPPCGCLPDESVVRVVPVGKRTRMGWVVTSGQAIEIPADAPVKRVGVVFFTS